jgi:putative transposase
MSRFRLYPTPPQAAALLEHCSHARYVWNLAVEQWSWWQPDHPAPRYVEQCRQLTEARATFPWLAEGSAVVQQQALRDFHQAWINWFAALRAGRRANPPGFRKRGRHEGFRMVGIGPRDTRRLNRRWGAVLVPKIGWVRFRWTRPVPDAPILPGYP